MKAIKFFAAIFAVAMVFVACKPQNPVIIPDDPNGDSAKVEMNIPQVATPGAGKTTVVLYVPEDTPKGCYAVGTVNGWAEKNTDLMFTEVADADSKRWVACTFDYASDMQIKVLAIPSDDAVAPGWSYQWGKNMDPENDLEEDNVVVLEGSSAWEIELENQGQPKLKGLADNGVVYIEVKAWATTPVIEAKPLEEAWIKHPWNGGDWTYQQMTKTADATFEYNCRYGANGVNIAGDANGGGENWYPGDQITIVDGAELATGDSVKFVFVSEKMAVGKVSVQLIEKGEAPEPGEPGEAKDITVKAKVPAAWTDTITAWVWPTGGDGQEVVPTKSGDWYVYTHNCAELNIIFKNGHGWNGDKNQTVDITGIKENACYELAQEGDAKATATAVDCQ